MAKIQEYKKAVAAFVTSLAGVWAIVVASDWSSKQGAIASIVPIVTAVVTWVVKNVPAAQ